MSEEKPKETASKTEESAPKTEKAREPKVGRMTAVELDKAIANAVKTQGGLWSAYGRSLLEHRAALGSAPAPAPKKR